MRSLITGITGQDGAYLAALLLRQGHEVYGTSRRGASADTWRLAELGITAQVQLLPLDLTDAGAARALMTRVQPDEVYNLAAQTSVAASFTDPLGTAVADGGAVVHLLEAVRQAAPQARFLQASSSEMFGPDAPAPQDECTPLRPRSPYAVAKAFAHWMTATYRESYDLAACAAILYSHHSPLHHPAFATRKVTQAVARIALGHAQSVQLGNLDVPRDWGYAPDFVDAMARMQRHTPPRDFVLATGEAHTLRAFIETAFACVDIGLTWEGHGAAERGIDPRSGQVRVTIAPGLRRPGESQQMLGNAAQARTLLSWQPTVSFAQLVEGMVRADLARVQRST